MPIGRSGLALVAGLLLAAAMSAPAGAAPAANEGPAVAASGASPDVGCVGDQPESGTNFPNSELEPWMSVNPTDGPAANGILGDNLVAGYQQDRWNNGGSKGIVTSFSTNGGMTWTVNPNTKSSICTGG